MRHKLNPRYGSLIGLTGNICTGKSLTLTVFKKMGFQTVSMDKYVGDTMNADNYLKNKIAERFPNSLVNGNISKKYWETLFFIIKMQYMIWKIFSRLTRKKKFNKSQMKYIKIKVALL